MKRGFTTGSCAAAAAKGAAIALLTGEYPDRVAIETPKGLVFNAELLDRFRAPDEASCGVRKDGGDDPDVTTGLIVYARVRRDDRLEGQIRIDGGEGVGRVTLPGLDQPVGAAAINSGPRRAIERELRDVAGALGYSGSFDVIISIPGGEEVAKRTFNPRLGIVGGLSVLGTSGVVEPMSLRAIVDTIRVELSQARALGRSKILVAPGNYGRDFINARYGGDLDRAIKCSNFIGQTIDMARELGFTDLLFCAHIGKGIKVAGGIMNTHSRESDARMELAAAFALEVGASREDALDILRGTTTDVAMDALARRGLEDAFMSRVAEKCAFYLQKRAGDGLRVETIVFSHKSEAVGASEGAKRLFDEAEDELKKINKNLT